MKDRLKSLLSRKFLLVVAVTVLLWHGKVTADSWMYVAMVYLGGNVFQKYVEKKT